MCNNALLFPLFRQKWARAVCLGTHFGDCADRPNTAPQPYKGRGDVNSGVHWPLRLQRTPTALQSSLASLLVCTVSGPM